MKKIFGALIILCLFAAEKTNAQLDRGTAIVGADLFNFNIGLKKGSQTNISLSPKAAWMLNSNFAVGGYVNFDLTTQKVAGTTYTNTGYGIGALARYYVNDPKVNLLRSGRWFFEGNAGFEGTNVKGGNSTNGLGLGIGPGYAYFITRNIALEGLLKLNENLGFGNTTSTGDLNFGLGFQIYLPGKATANKISNDMK
ncbi:MAG TPA: hypothetical protein VHB70_10890 [Parafilimonas sp.]|nr:hypothetical protein [Parafilimonas sp.]